MTRLVVILSFCFLLSSAASAQTADLPIVDEDQNETRLIESIKRDDLSAVLRLLDQGVSPDALDEGGTSALSWSISMNRAEIAEILLIRKAQVNFENKSDQGTALDQAALMGRVDLASMLINFGADVNHQDREGHTALMFAALGAAVKSAPPFVAGVLFDEQADETLKVMGTGHNQVAKVLLDAGANPDLHGGACDPPPLIIAAIHGNVELTKLLIEHRVDINCHIGEDCTALKLAETIETSEELKDVLNGIEDAKAKQSFLTWINSTTPNRREVAKILRTAGADPGSRTIPNDNSAPLW